MKRIAIDMDEVLADSLGKILSLYKQAYGIEFPREQLNGRHLHQAIPVEQVENIRSFPCQEGFFCDLEVIPGSQEVVKELHKYYEVFIVSAAMEFPFSLKEKYFWLQEHFPYIHWKNMVLCGDKSIIKADYLIDDHFKNLDTFSGQPIIFTSPHNLKVNDKRFIRVNHWGEVADLLLK